MWGVIDRRLVIVDLREKTRSAIISTMVRRIFFFTVTILIQKTSRNFML